MEIERKFLIDTLPEHLDAYPFHQIEQGYLCTEPVVRIRRQDEEYYLTYKSKGLMVREEYNLPLTREAYLHLIPKVDGILITKKRYLIPFSSDTSRKTSPDAGSSSDTPKPSLTSKASGKNGGKSSSHSPELSTHTAELTIELDVFEGELSPLILAEVEFSTEEEANQFLPPKWFGEDVTYSMDYHNSVLSQKSTDQ